MEKLIELAKDMMASAFAPGVASRRAIAFCNYEYSCERV
jgi:hypothetical protein